MISERIVSVMYDGTQHRLPYQIKTGCGSATVATDGEWPQYRCDRCSAVIGSMGACKESKEQS